MAFVFSQISKQPCIRSYVIGDDTIDTLMCLLSHHSPNLYNSVFTYVISLKLSVKASSVPKGSLRHVIAFEFLYFFISELHVHGTYGFVMKIWKYA